MDVWPQILLFVFGAAIGSFLNVVICRLQTRESFIHGRSHCPHCRAKLHWHDLIPLVSFMCLGGKCRYCRKTISWRYLFIEIITGALFVLGGITVADNFQLLIYLVAVSFFIILFVYDQETYIVPDSVSLPAIVIIFLLNLAGGGGAAALLLGALAGGGWFLAQFLLSRGRWVGGGDIRLGLLIGALVGFPMIGLSLMMAYVGGSLIAIGLVLAKRAKFGSRLPFATMLLPAAIITWLYGYQIWQTYIYWLGY